MSINLFYIADQTISTHQLIHLEDTGENKNLNTAEVYLKLMNLSDVTKSLISQMETLDLLMLIVF